VAEAILPARLGFFNKITLILLAAETYWQLWRLYLD
jgi:hypothetical protein